MQHLQLRCCKSPLKGAQLSRHISWDRSLSESASALHQDNHGTLRKGEHEFDLGVWDYYHWRTKDRVREREGDGGEWMGGMQLSRTDNISCYPILPLTQGENAYRWSVSMWHMGTSKRMANGSLKKEGTGRIIKNCVDVGQVRHHICLLGCRALLCSVGRVAHITF